MMAGFGRLGAGRGGVAVIGTHGRHVAGGGIAATDEDVHVRAVLDHPGQTIEGLLSAGRNCGAVLFKKFVLVEANVNGVVGLLDIAIGDTRLGQRVFDIVTGLGECGLLIFKIVLIIVQRLLRGGIAAVGGFHRLLQRVVLVLQILHIVVQGRYLLSQFGAVLPNSGELGLGRFVFLARYATGEKDQGYTRADK